MAMAKSIEAEDSQLAETGNSISRWQDQKANSEPSSEETFRHRDGIPRQHLEIFAASLGQPLCIDPQDLVFAACAASANADSLRRCDPGVTAGHRDRFQKIDSVRTAFWHFVTPGPINLSENCETAFRVTDECHIHSWIHEIIASVKFRDAVGCLPECESREMHGTEKRETQISFAIETGVCSQILFTENFHRDLIVRSQGVAARCAQRIIWRR